MTTDVTTMTVQSVLQRSQQWLSSKGIRSGRLEAEILLSHATGLTRVQMYTDPQRPLHEQEQKIYKEMLIRRGKNKEPVAYIVGQKEFYGLSFKVNKDVLIPRPETELLVDLALEKIPIMSPCLIIDVGTGSGCIAVAITSQRPLAQVIAIDISAAALDMAQLNAAYHGVLSRITFIQSDVLQALKHVAPQSVDMIVSNPPYIKQTEKIHVGEDTLHHEPALALWGDDMDGLGVHRRILEEGAVLLRQHATVLMELGFDQGPAMLASIQSPYIAGKLHRDLLGHERVVECLFQKVSE